MKSVGDFYVNIIPKLDQIALNTGISAVNATMDMASKLWSGGKKIFGFMSETSKVTADMVRFSESLRIPIERVQTLQDMFRMVGLSAEDANSAMQGLIESSSEKGLWGNADWARLSRHGIVASMFSGDPLKDLTVLNNVLSKTKDARVITDILKAVGLPLNTMNLLGKDPKVFADLMTKAIRLSISGKDAQANLAFQNQLLTLNLTMDKFKAELVSKMLPELSNIIFKLNELLTDKEFMSSVKTIASSTAVMADGMISLLEFLHIKTPEAATTDESVKDYIKNKEKFKVLQTEDKGGGWTLSTMAHTGSKWVEKEQNINVNVTASPEFEVQYTTTAKNAANEVVHNNNKQSIEDNRNKKVKQL